MGIGVAFGNSYPADPRSGAGITIETRGLTWKARLDFSKITYSATAPASGLLAVQNPDGSLTAFDLASLPISATLISSLLIGPVPANYPPRRGQVIAALETIYPGSTVQLNATVPSDPGDTTNRIWTHTLFVSNGGGFATFVRSTLGLTADQFAIVLNTARTITE